MESYTQVYLGEITEINPGDIGDYELQGICPEKGVVEKLAVDLDIKPEMLGR